MNSTLIKFSCVVVLTAVVTQICNLRLSLGQDATIQSDAAPSIDDAIRIGVDQLISLQHDDGAWPYEGVYRVRGKIPVGYRIGGTAIACQALLYATEPDHKSANRAIERGVQIIMADLENPLMQSSREPGYDVRVWGHIYALDLFCRLKASRRFSNMDERIGSGIERMARAVLHEQQDAGGWNYATRQKHAAFVTAPAVQALLWALDSGQDVPDEVFNKSKAALLSSRGENGTFAYSGPIGSSRRAELPGATARAPVSETTLFLLGVEREKEIAGSIDAFYEHWDELEKRRKKTGTHVPPYGVAPYYFYFGHRYLAQAIQALPKNQRAAQFSKFNQVLLKTRDADGTWNDRVFEQSKAYGTSMALLALLGDKVPLPKRLTRKGRVGTADK